MALQIFTHGIRIGITHSFRINRFKFILTFYFIYSEVFFPPYRRSFVSALAWGWGKDFKPTQKCSLLFSRATEQAALRVSYLEKGEGGVQPLPLLRSSGPSRKCTSYCLSLFSTVCSGCSFRHLRINQALKDEVGPSEYASVPWKVIPAQRPDTFLNLIYEMNPWQKTKPKANHRDYTEEWVGERCHEVSPTHTPSYQQESVMQTHANLGVAASIIILCVETRWQPHFF